MISRCGFGVVGFRDILPSVDEATVGSYGPLLNCYSRADNHAKLNMLWSLGRKASFSSLGVYVLENGTRHEIKDTQHKGHST